MTPGKLIIRNLLYYRRTNVAVVAGVAVAVAVLIGSLLIGDSTNGSLRDLALERLGKVDFVLERDRFFREDISRKLSESDAFANVIDVAAPAIIVEGAVRVQTTDEESPVVPHVTILGVGDAFWKLADDNDQSGGASSPTKLTGRDAVLNEQLARALGVKVGDTVLLTVPKGDDAPADSIR